MPSRPVLSGKLSRFVFFLCAVLVVLGIRSSFFLPANDPKDKFIETKLDEKVNMDFTDAPLEDVFKSIRSATQGPADAGIPIYVDPDDLKAAGASVSSKVSIVTKDMPLKTSLRLLLQPLGLTYRVHEGLLKIVADPDRVPPKP
jgi:hypothetical protein